MRALVTGAGGMLGRDVVRACEAHGLDVYGYGRAELDIVDAAAVDAVIDRDRPHVVFNCAAYTDVDGAEAEEGEATRVNGTGAGLLAAAAAAHGAAIVHVSTDYVFDGKGSVPYVESDAVAPLGAYGRSKLSGERAVAGANERHFIARTSWLFGTGGPNFAATMLRLGRERGAVRVVHDQVGSPTYTGHLAEVLVRIGLSDHHGVHHVAGGAHCSWYGFALEVFRQSGSQVDASPCATEEFPRPARRPSFSVLGTERRHPFVLPDWREGVADYLADVAVLG
jgi:dTDP-4-dehydrorhamnose reductase